MAATFECPHCAKRIKGREELVGKKVRCPGCQQSFVAAAGGDEPAAPIKAKATPAPAKAAKPTDDAQYGMEGIDTRARCPNCAELMVDTTAIICIHCGYNTLTRTYGKTKKVIGSSRAEVMQHLLPAICFAGGFAALVLVVLFFNTVVPPWFLGTRSDWVASEAVRMWSTMMIVGALWMLGMLAFRTFALQPLPEEVEKE
jgi:Zn finger protein HypA/HybF involved in hydrogenase expression